MIPAYDRLALAGKLALGPDADRFGERPERFGSDAKLARAGGAAPIPASSGSTTRHRLDRGGNHQLNLALHRLAVNKGKYVLRAPPT
jgi:transposase